MPRVVGACAVLLMFLSVGVNRTAAQGSSAASISGVVKDTSGAVLPGVTVEASSPSLLEKVRSTITDDRGGYRITELSSGTYTVAFTLPGFSVVKREGVELTPNFNASINADLAVGALTETITVSGNTPLVDTQNVTQQALITKETLDTIPTNKSQLSLAALMPSVVTPPNAQDVGGSKGEQSVRISVHGGKPQDAKLLQDGMRYNSLVVQGTGRGLYINPLSTQEVVIELGAGGSAEYSTGAAQVNLLPRDGGNRFTATFFTSATSNALQSDNFTDELRAEGLTSVGTVRKVYDLNGVIGGPVLKDKLWFVTGWRKWGNKRRAGNLYRALDPNSYLFVSDLSRPVEFGESNGGGDGRFTYQVTAKDKVTFSYAKQHNRNDSNTGALDQGAIAVEANGNYCQLDDLFQSTWTHPKSSRLLFEAGGSFNRFGYGANFGKDLYLSDFILCGGDPDHVQIVDSGLGFTYHGTGSRAKSYSNQANGRVSMSYVTGRHHFKTGLFALADAGNGHQNYTFRAPLDTGGAPVSYTFTNGTPTSLTEYATPLYIHDHLRPELGIFAQDTWQMNRLTLSLGLRYEYVRAYVPAQDQPAGVLVGARSFPKVDCLPCWHDLNPRIGVAYDLFGDGKTAVKAGIGRYVQAVTIDLADTFSPVNSAVNSTTRAWNDLNGNYIPDCDLTNPLMNLECGPMANANFGKFTPVTRPDPNWITGWGNRPYDWKASLEVERQLSSSVAMSAGYHRTWFGNFTVTDNLAVTPADYSPYCVTAPVDARLPGDTSGQPICGLYDLNPDKFGQTNNLVTFASNYGKPTEIYNGVDVNFTARLPKAAQVSGGWNVGNAIQFVGTGIISGGNTQSSTNNCFVVDSPQQLFRCKIDNPYQHRIKVNGSYPIPWDFRVAAVFQSVPGATIGATTAFPTAAIAPSLGRSLSGGTRTATIDMLQPLTNFGPRVNQLDVRLTRTFKLGGNRRIQGNFDIYNITNSSTVVSYINTYALSGTNRWRQPAQILDARLLKFGVQIDF